ELGVTGSSVLTVFGPLVLDFPATGGSQIQNQSAFRLFDANGMEFIFEFQNTQAQTPLINAGAIAVQYTPFDDVGTVIDATVAAINGTAGLGVVATNAGGNTLSLGIVQDDQYDQFSSQLSATRGTPADGETITITQGAQVLVLEFDTAIGGGGVQAGAVAVPVQPGDSPDQVAATLSATINNNRGSLNVNATPADGGRVELDDTAGTEIDVTNAQSISVSGLPGGAVAVPFTQALSLQQLKQSIIDTINQLNADGETVLSASERGGNTFFIENAVTVSPELTNYFLPAVADLAGNPLKPNAVGTDTQFTILLPSIGLDFGDAPDPVNGLPGQYPTLAANDGARHVIGGPRLGNLVDAEPEGQPTQTSDGDDLSVLVLPSTPGGVIDDAFVISQTGGSLSVGFDLPNVDDGEKLVLDTGFAIATFEVDFDGRFDEDSFAISAPPGADAATLADALRLAILESPIAGGILPGAVTADAASGTLTLSVDDEDGVLFVPISEIGSPGADRIGRFNVNVPTPITIGVAGNGVVEAWIDFNGNGLFTDPGEQVISRSTPNAVFTETIVDGVVQTVRREISLQVPEFFRDAINSPIESVARFRVSASGGLAPTGLALSGEVEDYRVLLVPGSPPTVDGTNQNLTYNVEEGAGFQPDGSVLPALTAFDITGSQTASINDDGLLALVVDPDGDPVEVFDGDVRVHDVIQIDEAGEPVLDDGGNEIVIGTANVESNGRFTFTLASDDAFGSGFFTIRATDRHTDPQLDLVNPTAISVTINVNPVNDAPQLIDANMDTVNTVTDEDVVLTIPGDTLTALFNVGADNETDQTLAVATVGIVGTPFTTSLGGSVAILSNGDVEYTPPVDFPGPAPDTFIYDVTDVLPDGSTLQAELSETSATVSIMINAVNDAPRPTNDVFPSGGVIINEAPDEFTIAIADLLANDTPGPASESMQTLTLVGFDTSTSRGGSVRRDGVNLIYTPNDNFSGVDSFSYTVEDNGENTPSASAVVTLTVTGDNDAPIFLGTNGPGSSNTNPTRLEFVESKSTTAPFQYNLNTWFSDPEGDPIEFTVTTNENPQRTILTSLNPNTNILSVSLPPFEFGNVQLTVVASNQVPVGQPPVQTEVVIDVIVEGTPDAPQRTSNQINATTPEDVTFTTQLESTDGTDGLFFDPDREDLTYTVTQLGNIFNPTPAQIAADPLVQNIQFIEDGNGVTQLVITPEPNAPLPGNDGSTVIAISASDGVTVPAGLAFTFAVTPVNDPPVGLADNYTVPLRSTLSVLNPATGLLGNDSDVDGDNLRVDLTTVVGQTRGTLIPEEDGTFTYVNTSGNPGEVDTFTYRPIDTSGVQGAPVTVSITIGPSRYQNPTPDLATDVNADGFVSPIDALLIINLLNERSRATGGTSATIPVDELLFDPPNFVDVDGNGIVSATDALAVISRLAFDARNGASSGESLTLRSGTTTSYAVADLTGLPNSNINLVEKDPRGDDADRTSNSDNDSDGLAFTGGDATSNRDALLAGGLEIQTQRSGAADLLMHHRDGNADAFDSALSDWGDDDGGL
ncbi:MAG: Ig-like domain-containing protein, partial [Planctomycetota bacterium]